MNATTSAILWLSMQIAMFSLVGWLAFALLKRRGPNSATMCAAMVLALTLPLAAFVVSPWPRWISKSQISNLKSQTTLKHETATSPENLVTTEMQPRLPGDEIDPATADAVLYPWWQPAVELFQPADNVAAKPAESHWHWQTWLPWVLAAGIGISLARLAIGMWAVQKMKRQSQPVDDAALLDQVAILAAELGSPGVELRESKMLRSAVTIGWRRPLLLLPADWRTWSDTERRIVLAHELAHVLRRDFLTTLLARFAMAIHFYQPLVLWLGRQLRIQQELAADNCAAAVTGNRQTYLTTLAQMALRADEQPLPWAARAFLPGTSMLIKRVAWLKQKQTHVERSLGRAGRWTLAIGMVVIALAVAGIRGPSDSGSAAVLAADGDANPQAAAKPLARSFEFIPADAKFVAAISPSEMSKLPSVAKVLSQAYDPQFEHKHGFKFSDLADVQMVASSFNKPPERIVLRGAQPMDWKKILAKNFPSLEPREAAPYGYYIVVKESDRAEGFGPCFFVPDDRTIVAGSEQEILNILKARVPAAPSPMDPGLFPEFVNKPVAMYADISIIKSAIGSNGNPKKFEDNPMAAALAPVLDHVAYARLGVEPKEKDSAETILTVKCDTPTGASQVTGTLDAARVLVLNVLKAKKQAWDQTAAPPVPQAQIVMMKGLFDAAESVLSNLKMGSERNVATIWTTVDLDAFTKIGFVLPAINESREAARRMQSMNSMKQLALGCLQFESKTNHLPGNIYSKDGKPLLSWRVAILQQLGYEDLFKQFHLDEPWDSEHNKAQLEKMPDVFRDPHADPKTTSPSYFMPMGKGMIGDEGKGVQLKDIFDGTSKTILIVDAQRDIPWTKPEDIEIDADPTKPLPPLGGNFEGLILAVFGDGHVEVESLLADPKQLHALFTIDGREPAESPLQPAPGAAAPNSPPGAAPQPMPPPGAAAPALNLSRESARRSQSMNNLKMLALSMHNFNAAKKRFPPAAIRDKDGKPLLSWRVAILPYIDEGSVYQEFHLDEPWDSEHNKALIAKMPAVFRDPHDDEKSISASYFMPTGQGMFGGDEKGTQMKNIRDGSWGTIMLVDAKRDIPWTKPEDIEIDPDPTKPLPAMGGNFEAQILAAFADGHVEVEPQSADPKQLHSLFTIDGGEQIDGALKPATPKPPVPVPQGAAAPAKSKNVISIRQNFLGPGGMSQLVAIPAVQKEIGIEKGNDLSDQINKARQAQVTEFQRQLTEASNAGRLTNQETIKLQNEAAANSESAVKKLLKPDQFARLQQIALQDAGATALADTPLAKPLEITKDQQEKLTALQSTLSEKQREIRNPTDGERPAPEVIQKKLQDLKAQSDQQAEAILSKPQQEKYAEMKGKVFDLSLLPAQFFIPLTYHPPIISISNDGLMGLALDEPVLKELGIEKNSPLIGQLQKLRDEYSEQMKGARLSRSSREAAYPYELVDKIQAKIDPELKQVLTPEQLSRLWQINWQTSGEFALYYPEVIKTLGLTPEQQKKIDGLVVDLALKRSNTLYPKNVPPLSNEEILKKAPLVFAERDKKINEILTPEQQQKFSGLKGKPFDVTLLGTQNDGQPPASPAPQPMPPPGAAAPAESGRLSNGLPILLIPPSGLVDVALKEPVLKELGIEKDSPVVGQLQKLREDYIQQLKEMIRTQTTHDTKNPIGVIANFQAKFDPDFKKLLTPEQFSRLRQINWQCMGEFALYDPEVIKTLDIKPDQLKKFDSLIAQTVMLQSETLSPANGQRLNRDEILKKAVELNAEHEKYINNVLTPEQQQKFVEVKGKPFDLTLLGTLTDGQPNKESSASPFSDGAKRSTIEFHIAETEAGEGLTEAEEPGHPEKIYLHPQVELNIDDLASVSKPTTDGNGRAVVNLGLMPAGAKKMATLTKQNLFKKLAIVIDGKVITAPKIQSEISNDVQITGNFNKEEAERIYNEIIGK